MQPNLQHYLRCLSLILIFVIGATTLVPTVQAQCLTGFGGRVFKDYNYNGIADETPVLGVLGVEIKAFGENGFTATTTTDVNGQYCFSSAPLGQRYRVEFRLPATLSYLKPTAFGTNSGTATQFINPVSVTTNVDWGVAEPSDFCQANPPVITPCYVNGDPLQNGTSADSIVLVSVPFGVANAAPSSNKSGLLKNSQIGTVWGLTYHRNRRVIISNTNLRRHSGFGPGGAGAIYFTDYSNPTTPSVLGSFNIWAGPNPRILEPLPADADQPSRDSVAFKQVGKLSLGGAAISNDETQLFVMNLYSRKLFVLDLTTFNSSGNVADISVLDSIPVPTPCGATGEFRPWAVKYANGKVYIGGVCDASVSTTRSDLRAYVYELNGSAWTSVIDFPLDFQRGAIFRNRYPMINHWEPWKDDYTQMLIPDAFNYSGDFIYPQPILSDIEFDVDGSLILGFLDRMGHQSGYFNYAPSVNSSLWCFGFSGGDIMRVCNNGGVLAVENATTSCKTMGGETDGQGPGGGEFYWSDYWPYSPFNTTADLNAVHNEIALGGIGLIKGTGTTVSTVFDPLNDAQTGGLTWFNNTTGGRNKSFEVYGQNGNPNNIGFFGKASGLADLTMACDPAPLEIGNRVWVDCNGNGVQDPNEDPLSNVAVTLYDANCVQVDATTTGMDGSYYFREIEPKTKYYIVFGDGQWASNQLTLGRINYVLTKVNMGFGANADENDSDATIGGAGSAACFLNKPYIEITTKGIGCSDHTLDAGFAPANFTVNSVVGTNETCRNANDGQIVITATAASGVTLEYSKDGGMTWQTSNTFSSLAPATYTIKVRNPNAICGSDYETTVTIAAGPSVNPPVFGNNDGVCRNETTLKNGGLRVTCDPCSGGGSPVVTWWTAAQGGTKVGTGSPFNPIAAGVVDNSVVGVTPFFAQCECGACISPSRTRVEFSVFAQPEPVITGSTLVCPSALLTYSTPSVSGNTYQWTVTPASFGSIVGSATGNSVQIRWTSQENAGPFTVRVVETTPDGCSKSAEIEVYTRQVNFACLASVNLTLNGNCQSALSVVGVLGNIRGAADIKIQLLTLNNEILEEGFGSISVDGISLAGLPYSLIISKFRYRVIEPCQQITCWGDINIEDKEPPVITNCPTNVTLSCGGDIYNLCATGQFPNATNRQICSSQSNAGVAVDCSPYEQRYNDVITDYACTGETVDGITWVTRKVARSWILTDKFGNISLSCTQNIYLRTISFESSHFNQNDQILTCGTDLTGFALEAGLGGSLYRPLFSGTSTPVKNIHQAALCEPYASLKEVMILDVCGGGKVYMRKWEIRLRCDNSLVTTLTQTVTVKDVSLPTGNIAIENYSLNASPAYCFNMNGMLLNNLPTKTRALLPINQALGASVINIKGLADPSTCLMSRVSFRLSNLDATNCAGFNSNPTVSISDNRLTLSNGVWNGAFMFANPSEVQTFTITLTDACGNTTIQTVNVSYEDNAAPVAIADATTVQIPVGSCTARLNVAAINENSTDNCGIKFIMMRKMDATANTCWTDFLDYSVEDACRTDHMVILRIVDYKDQVSEAMVPVTVNFKPTLICSDIQNITRECTSNDLLNFRSLFTDPTSGFISSHQGCLNVTITEDNLASLDLGIHCNTTTIVRSWKATATYCSAGVSSTLTSTACTQRLTVTPVQGFRVPRLANENINCAEASVTIGTTAWIEAEKNRIINGAELLDCNGIKTCAAPVVEVETWEFRSNEFCKIFKVRYTILDHCARPYPTYAAPFWGRTVETTASRCYNTTEPTSGMIQDRENAVVYERYIYINDRTAPTATTTLTDICDGSAADTDADVCQVGFALTLTGSDNCTTGLVSNLNILRFMWSLQMQNGTTWTEISTGNTPSVNRQNLAVGGTYRVIYRITDLCGNVSNEFAAGPFRTIDCKTPEIRIHNKIVALGGQTGNTASGMATLLYRDIRNAIFDNCDGDLTFSTDVTLEKGGITTASAPSVARGTQSLMFTCDDLAASGSYLTSTELPVRVWAVDVSGNWNYAIATITLQDNDRICSQQATIQGLISNNAGTAIDNVNVTARLNNTTVATANTAINGRFDLNIGAHGANAQVTAAKTTDADVREGVTTADIATISRHILGSQTIDNPYSIIAADVDKNGSVEATDMLLIRRLILFIAPTLPAGNFRFVDKAYNFRNSTEPLAEDFPEVISIRNAQAINFANFAAVKLGDVNNSYRHVLVRGSQTLTLTTGDIDIVKGNEYVVSIHAKNFDVVAFQGTFSSNGLTVKSIQSGNLSNMTDANFGQFKNAVTASWNGKASADATLVTITFVANKSGKLSEMLFFGSALTLAEAVANNGDIKNVVLKFNSGKVSGAEFALYQNIPNPVATTTKVGFNLPNDESIRFTVFNAEGKIFFTKNGEYKAGYNEIILDKAGLAAGILYYKIETPTHSAVKKMVVGIH